MLAATYISVFFDRINLDADETEVRSIVSKFVEDLENKFKDEPEEQPEEPTKKRALDDVVEIFELPEFGERLKKFRLEENLSLPQLSERTGIPYDTLKIYFATEYTPSTASKKKKKPPTPKMSNAVELAKAFGFSLDFLLGVHEDKLLIIQYSAARGVFHNLYRMLQYANFTIRTNPESEEIEAVSNNRYLYYFFRRIQNLDSMDDLDEVIEETEKYCKDYKMVVSESGEIMLDDEYKDYINSEIFNQIHRAIAIRAALDYKESENEE
jgi:transcriptional regulator with XRE-family HTH domain